MKTILPLAVAIALSPLPARALEAADLVGKWGLAAYFDDKDAAATERSAKAQCNAPYTIARGPTGGVMLHLPDATKTSEMVIKSSLSTVYVGPPGSAGGRTDREILRADARTLIMKWLDPADARRYGTMVFARCGK